jgi:hypothetical protein
MLYDQGPPQHRLVHRNTLALRYNPLGLIYDGRFMYRLRLYESPSLALRDNFVGVGVAPTLSPACLRIGPYLEVNPLTLLNLWATVQFVQYFGTFDLAQGYPGAQSNYSDTTIKANTANRFAAKGWEATVGATLQLKLGPVVVRSMARLIYGSLNLKPGDRVYYDQLYDVLSPNQGFTFSNDLDVLYQGLSNKLIAGARYTATAPFYDASRHLDPTAASQQVDNSMHRVGPLIGYTFRIQDGATFNTPTVFVLVQWWLKSRYRAGTETSAALPLLGLGFQTTGDFLSIR